MTQRVRTALACVVGFVVAFGVVVLVKAFADTDDDGTDALTVVQALEAPSQTEVVVEGWLFFDEVTGPLLCSERSQQAPPLCAGSVLRLRRLDPNRVALERPEDPDGTYDAYSDSKVTLLGTKLGAVLEVEDVLR